MEKTDIKLGWDTDELPKDVRSVVLTMYKLLKKGV